MSERAYRELRCESALTRLKRRIPYGWDLNIYRGCEHGCQYCYAIYSHQYLEEGGKDYFTDIFAKVDVREQLERELASPKWTRDVINIGGVTDSYQPAEAQFKLMPDILRLLIKYRTPAIISTKSDLILRDYDLIDELSRLTYINVAATVTTMDEDVRKKLEPGAVESGRRFEMLREFRKTNASIGLHVMPIIPYLTDSRENMDGIFRSGKESGVHYVLPGTLYLRGKTKTVFFDFIEREFPEIHPKLKALYKTGGAGTEYKDGLYEMVNERRDFYGLSGNYMKVMKEKRK